VDEAAVVVSSGSVGGAPSVVSVSISDVGDVDVAAVLDAAAASGEGMREGLSISGVDVLMMSGVDMHTLVWTRGDAFPLDQLASRLKCPNRGSRKITVVVSVPNQPSANTASVP
jgi:hypothetical protein